MFSASGSRIPQGRIFMQDGAPSGTMAYLARKGQKVIEDWPPYSPDLNPIENLWSHLDQKIAERAPNTLEGLIATAKAVWAEIPMDFINNFTRSFKTRLATRIE
eukprot:GILI01056666.1.p2 GENE.GILI01056666.1~~GILI01056666.1.p2  ORF type:complete len:104 (+),score=19.89 GILI01056666.1:75-386(+)